MDSTDDNLEGFNDLDIRIISDDQNLGSPQSYINVKVEDHANVLLGLFRVPADVYIVRLAPALAHATKKTLTTRYGVSHKEFSRVLCASETLASAGVKDGDTIRVLPNVSSRDIPWMNYRNLQLVDAVLTNRLQDTQKAVTGLFFYSKNDYDFYISLFRHINHDQSFYFDFISPESSKNKNPLIFLVEEPCSDLKSRLSIKLGNLYNTYAENVQIRLDGKEKYVPTEASSNFKEFDINDKKAYLPLSQEKLVQIGEKFGISPGQFPCLLMYEKLSSKSALLFEINCFQKVGLFHELGTNILLEEDWGSPHPLDEIQKEMTKFASKHEIPSTSIQKIEMETTIIEAIAATIDLLDQP